jgi:AraC-like DNA-binding protein
MAIRPEEAVHFRTLHDSPIVQVREYVCSACKGGPGPEEESEVNTLVLMRRGTFCRHFGRQRVATDVNQAAFFRKGSTYRVSHPGEGGDRGTVFSVPQRILREFIREWDPSIDDQPERSSPFSSSPCDSGLFQRHRELVRALESQGTQTLEPFWVDVTALQIYADALGAGFFRRELPRGSRKEGTMADHVELVEAGKLYFADHLGERLTLDEVARALYTSPFHFARVFQRWTGISIHRYLTLLRLRASLERAADGQEDLAALALDLGFSSHSHFTDSFRREFGETPSEVRRKATVRGLRELSKNLEA